MRPQNSQTTNRAPSQSTPTQTNIDIFNSLRIPDAIKDLPKFDGNPRLLNEFINNVEEILLYIRGSDNTPYGQILLRAIRNKIEGQANEILNMYGTPLIWDEMKNNLIMHYADKRTETSLIRDLHNAVQLIKTTEAFYGEIIEIQSALCNNILLNERDTNVVQAKKELYAEMCLNSFLTGLNEPLGSRIRTMQPQSLATALSFCIKEQNIYYQRNRQQQRNQYKPYNRQNQNNYQHRNTEKSYDNQQTQYNNNRYRNNDQYNNNGYRNNNQYIDNQQAQYKNNRNRHPKHTNSSGQHEPTTTSMAQNKFRTRQNELYTNYKPGNVKFGEVNTMSTSAQQSLDRYFENDLSNCTNIEDEGNFRKSASNNQPGT